MQKLVSRPGRIVLVVCCIVLCSAPACFLTPPDVTGWFCSESADCLSPLICNTNQGRCLLPCFDASDCKVGQTCTQSFCSLGRIKKDGSPQDKTCNSQAIELCNGLDDNCNNQIDEGINCSSEGELCDLSAPSPVPCKPGLVCASFTVIHPRICLKICDIHKPSSCSDSRFNCLQLGDGSTHVCVESGCKVGDKCQFELEKGVPHTCDPVSASMRVCRPYFPTGTIAFGKRCLPVSNEFCTEENKCARRKTDSFGFCTILCAKGKDAPCEMRRKGSKCRTFEGRYSVCFPPCLNNQDCPSEMSCSAEQLCAFD